MNLIGLEMAEDLRVDRLVEKARPLLHDGVNCVDLQQLVRALHFVLCGGLQRRHQFGIGKLEKTKLMTKSSFKIRGHSIDVTL
jgi:hypothetical protein